MEILGTPLVGLVSLGIVLATLTARISFPFRIPGALAALLVGLVIQFIGTQTGWIPHAISHSTIDPSAAIWPTAWLSAFRFEWIEAWSDSIKYLPVVIPFALGTVVGGIDCTESAAAAGDEYNTARIISVEGFATIIAGLCGGVIQTTALGAFLTDRKDPPANLEDFVDHIDYMVEKIGLDHVGISSDFDGGGGGEGWKDASETKNVTKKLRERGYTDTEIAKLWGGNLLRVLDQVQEIGEKMRKGKL